ncbi:MAG: hypothetical protein Q9195_007254 [Heterodermia aff. obscurata]
MRYAIGSKILIPSPKLLRFLGTQLDEVCFFTINSIATASKGSFPRTDSLFGRCSPASRRRLSTSPRPLATVQASILNFDCLRPISRNVTANNAPPLQHGTLSGLLASKDLKEKPFSTRYISTNVRPLLDKILGPRRTDFAPRPQEPAPLPSLLDDVNGASLGRSKASRVNELKLRCTELNEEGKVTLVNGEFKKTELIAKYGLLPRDLRKIDSSLLPHILVRPSAILINLLHLRVLIKYNRVLVLDAYGTTDSHTQSVFMYDLCGKLAQKDNPRQPGSLSYELRALEAVLISVTTGLEAEFEGVSDPVVRVLRELEEDIDRDKLRHLLVYSKKLGTFEQKARLVRDAIDDILEADDDLVSMYLTEKAQGKFRAENDHTEVEMLLESYHKVCDEIVQVSGNLVSNIRNTEEIVKAILDANRNSLMLLDLKFSIGTLGIGSGAFIAGLYGMNLKNFIEESDLGFLGVTSWSFIFAAVVCAYGMIKLRKVQRVSMWGEQGKRSRGNWRDVAAMPPLPGESRVERLKRSREAKHQAWSDYKQRIPTAEGANVSLPVVRRGKLDEA